MRSTFKRKIDDVLKWFREVYQELADEKTKLAPSLSAENNTEWMLTVRFPLGKMDWYNGL